MKELKIEKINYELEHNAAQFIEQSDKAYNEQIEIIASSLASHVYEKPIVLLAGPSGSGKTTSAFKIEEELEKLGVKTHTVSMDDYFLPISREDIEQGIDFESPARIDMDLFNEHMQLLSNGKAVEIPDFNFKTQKRRKGKILDFKEGDIVVVEGIHALNPDITGECDDFANYIYTSVRTRIVNDKGIRLHPSKIRLLRRLIRDLMFRGRTIEETLDMFESVARGEDRYIMSYKYRSTYEIDTFIGYEANVYSNLLLSQFKAISKTYRDYDNFKDAEKFMSALNPVYASEVPKTSLIREFIGGSEYDY